MASGLLPKSPVSSSLCDEVPHIFIPKSHLEPREFLISSAKRLLQQYRPIATNAPQQTAPLFDQLVCAKQDRCWYRKAESLGSFDVDGHLKFGGQLDRQLRRFCAVQNTIDIGRGTPHDIFKIGSV